MAKGLLGEPDVDRLIATLAGNTVVGRETSILEFKASWKPMPGDNASEDECRWNVVKAIIAMANASGGSIVLGLAEDPNNKNRLLAGNADPDGILKRPGKEGKDLAEHTKSQLLKGDGKFHIGDGALVEIEGERPMERIKDLVEFHICKSAKLDAALLVIIIVEPIEDNEELIFVKAIGGKKFLYYRDSQFPKTNRIEDLQDLPKYLVKRRPRKLEYAQVLQGVMPPPWPPWLRPLMWSMGIVIALLVITLATLVIKYRNVVGAEQRTAKLSKLAEAERDKLQNEKEELEEIARKKDEELKKAQKEAEDALTKADKTHEEANAKVAKAEVERDKARKDAEDAQIRAEEAQKKAEEALANAEQAKKDAEEASKSPLFGRIKKLSEQVGGYISSKKEEVSEKKTYSDKVEQSYNNFSDNTSRRYKSFDYGLTKSGPSKFESVRKSIPGVSELLTLEVVNNLVESAAHDKVEGKKGNEHLRQYINKHLLAPHFVPMCKNAIAEFQNDGQIFEGKLEQYFIKLQQDLSTNTEVKPENNSNSSRLQTAFASQIFAGSEERVDRTSEAIARLVLKYGDKQIDEMEKRLKAYREQPDKVTFNPEKVNVTKLRRELVPAVEEELGKIVEKVQKDTIGAAKKSAEKVYDDYAKKGKELQKAALKK